MKHTFDGILGIGHAKYLGHPHSHVVHGGGGSSSTTTSSLPDWAEPYAKEAVGTAVGLEKAGAFGEVADLTLQQQDALQRQQELGQRGGVIEQIADDAYRAGQVYRDAAGGTGIFGADALGQQTEALQPVIEQQTRDLIGKSLGQQSRLGNLGSARADALTSRTAGDLAGQLAKGELDARRQAAFGGAQGATSSIPTLQSGFTAGTQITGGVGDTLQQQNQREADARYQSVQRLFGLLGSGVAGQKTVQTGRGGK